MPASRWQGAARPVRVTVATCPGSHIAVTTAEGTNALGEAGEQVEVAISLASE